jgi:aminopeptidase-like protein
VTRDFERAVLWILNLSDGRHSITAIAERSGLALSLIEEAAAVLEKQGLILPCGDPGGRTDPSGGRED